MSESSTFSQTEPMTTREIEQIRIFVEKLIRSRNADKFEGGTITLAPDRARRVLDELQRLLDVGVAQEAEIADLRGELNNVVRELNEARSLNARYSRTFREITKSAETIISTVERA